MRPSLLLLTGAPECSSLDWQHTELLQTFITPVSRFTGLANEQDAHFHPENVTTGENPAWRAIPLERQHLKTGFSQNHAWQEDYQGAIFFTPDSCIEEVSQISDGTSRIQAADIQSVDQVLTQFYENSYAVHEDIATSQLAPRPDNSNSMASDSFSTTEYSIDSLSNSFPGTKSVPNVGHLTSLTHIPNATYLNSIYPQTMTIDVVVGLISVSSPRNINTRRGASVELIELLVGDETRSGFGINFWLSSSQFIEDDTQTPVTGLRCQDVVLIRNVALSSFRGKVHGQSLRKNLTKVYLLYRNKVDKSDLCGCYKGADFVSSNPLSLQLEKTRKVREWVLKFVGGARVPSKGMRQVEGLKEILPPDTQ